MKILICAIGKLSKDYWRQAEEDYLRRLQHYGHVERRELKDVPTAKRAPAQIQEAETERILQALPAGAFLVALDRRGENMTSTDLAAFLESHRMRGTPSLVFAVGGPFGFSRRLLERADMVLSLSAMTLPHELARIVLLEQLYRAMTILKGEKYHK